MYKKTKNLLATLFTGLIFCLSITPAAAQSAPEPCVCEQDRQYESNLNSWWMYTGTYRFAEKWSIHAEGQVRRLNGVSDWQQYLIRSGMNYALSANALLTGGYAYAGSYSYENPEMTESYPEHRLFEQLLLRQHEGKFGLQHRFRLEQRWIKAPLAEEFTYTNRARYMIRADLPLVGNTIADRTPYVAFSNEVFINFGEHVQKNIFDQNRLWSGFGYRFNKKLALEVGYMNQQVQCANGYEFQNNHTITFGIWQNLDFRKSEG